ncbi:MAG: glycosyltransferase family 4 protein, partial [Planctomycetes bacterium]|nr:glycosyltransferase family 4 protein [Planctomycetota bacterium]
FDFENPPPVVDAYSSDVRAEIGLEPGDVMILQPTRVVPRKGIEHAIQLVEMLGDPKYKLVISHDAGDEGLEYMHGIEELARSSGVDIRFVAARIGERRQYDSEGKKIYTLWDLYPHADLVTYFSLYEGFGNALLESIYFRIPVLVQRYSIFIRDIEPKGFRLPVMEGFPTRRLVEEVRRLFEDQEYRREIVDHNYAVAAGYFSYAVLRRKLRSLIANVRGLG